MSSSSVLRRSSPLRGSSAPPTLVAAMGTHPGRVRRGNQDACAMDAERGIFVVCDGMGGAAGGEIASRFAADSILGFLGRSAGIGFSGAERLARGTEAANELVYGHARRNRSLRGMGTTLVALLAEPESASGPGWGTVWVANVGDSRCYRLREGRLEQLTDDHSLVEEQVRAGQMTRAQAEGSPIRNVITRAVGSMQEVDADIAGLPGESGDLYLLATDGLTRELEDQEIAAILMGRPKGRHGEEARLAGRCDALIQAAIASGGRDNVTCLLVELR